MEPIYTLASGILGILIGAFLQHIFVKQREEKKEINERKKQCYLALIDSISGLASAQSTKNLQQIVAYQQRFEHSKLLLSITAGQCVLKELSTWFTKHQTNITAEAQESFSMLMGGIRKDCGMECSDNTKEHIKKLLFFKPKS